MLGRVAKLDSMEPWLPRTIPPELRASDVHVWYFPLIVPAEHAVAWRAILSPAERERADRFAFPHLRERYLAAHALLRRVLAEYLHTDPAGFDFLTAERGKPYLTGHPLHFNLSHTGDHGLLAVTKAGEVGVDIEGLDRKLDRAGIAERFFSRAEADELAALPVELQAEGFCNLWTRKEAWLKATGVGISEGLNQVEFNCRPGDPARLLRIEGDSRKAGDWFVGSFRSPGDCVGAVALRADRVNLHRFQHTD